VPAEIIDKGLPTSGLLRAFHLKELSDLFVQVVRLAREMGLVKLVTIAEDGTKVKANARHCRESGLVLWPTRAGHRFAGTVNAAWMPPSIGNEDAVTKPASSLAR
jgi:hypothetical protein